MSHPKMCLIDWYMDYFELKATQTLWAQEKLQPLSPLTI